MIRIATALALLLALGHEAAANPQSKAPRLKELVSVTSEVVRIGDLVENAGPAAGVPIFRAPDLGQTGSVPVRRIADALRPHDLADLDTDGLSEVIVTRLSRTITAKTSPTASPARCPASSASATRRTSPWWSIATSA